MIPILVTGATRFANKIACPKITIACLIHLILSHLKIKQPYLKYLQSELRLEDGLMEGRRN